MGKKAGTLLWNRMRITIPGAVNGGPPGTFNANTGLIQENKSFDGMSPLEPALDERTIVVAMGPDITIGSRVQVIPMSPLAEWTPITHGEPFLDPVTNTVHVLFSNAGVGARTLNVLFWDPHSMIGPGSADTYNPPD